MWTDRLNQRVSRFSVESCVLDVLGWSYSEFLVSNVPHRHTYFEACLVGKHGEGRFEICGQSHSLLPGTFFLARPGEIHQILNTSAPDMELFWVSFSIQHAGNDEIGRLWQAFKTSSTRVVPASNLLTTQWEALRAVAEVSERYLGSDVAMQNMALALMLSIAQSGAGSDGLDALTATSIHPHVEAQALAPHQNQLARLGAQYVHDNLDRPLPIHEIARYLGVSRRQISRLFAGYTGVSPAAYIERARLDRAEGLLRQSQQSVKEIAHAVGYSDVYHFTRAFTRVVGTPPAQYRIHGPRHPRPSGPHIQNLGSLV